MWWWDLSKFSSFADIADINNNCIVLLQTLLNIIWRDNHNSRRFRAICHNTQPTHCVITSFHDNDSFGITASTGDHAYLIALVRTQLNSLRHLKIVILCKWTFAFVPRQMYWIHTWFSLFHKNRYSLQVNFSGLCVYKILLLKYLVVLVSYLLIVNSAASKICIMISSLFVIHLHSDKSNIR